MYSISNKDHDEIIEFLTDFREISKDIPRKGLLWENKKRRAKFLYQKMVNKKQEEQ